MAVLVLAIPALAQQSHIYQDRSGWIEDMSGAVPAAPTMIVRMKLGSVSIHGTGTGKFIVYRLRVRTMSGGASEARRKFAQCRFSAIKAGKTVTIVSSSATGRTDSQAVLMETLEIEVPQNMALVRIATRGDTAINRIEGRVEVTSGGGNLRVDNVGGSVKATTAGGSVAVGTVGGDVELFTGGGNVSIDSVKGHIVTSSGGGNIVVSSADQGVSLETAGGAIDVHRCKGALSAQTGGGNLELGQVGGKALLQTAGGSIRMSSGSGPVVATTGAGQIELYGLTQGVQVQSGAGRIVAEFVGPSLSNSTLDTGMGDVIVYLGPDIKATIRAEVIEPRGHRIRSDFPTVGATESAGGLFGSKHLTAEGKLNGGGPELRIRATAGDIELRRTSR